MDENDLPKVMWRVALFLSNDRKYHDSEKLWHKIIQIQRRSDSALSYTLLVMNNLANTYRDQGGTGEAAALQEEVLQKRRRILGEEHPDTLASMNNLANTYSD